MPGRVADGVGIRRLNGDRRMGKALQALADFLWGGKTRGVGFVALAPRVRGSVAMWLGRSALAVGLGPLYL